MLKFRKFSEIKKSSKHLGNVRESKKNYGTTENRKISKYKKFQQKKNENKQKLETFLQIKKLSLIHETKQFKMEIP